MVAGDELDRGAGLQTRYPPRESRCPALKVETWAPRVGDGARSRGVRLLGKHVDDADGGLDFGGVSVEEVGLVGPLAYRVEGGLLELFGAGDDGELFDAAVFADDGVEQDGALDPLFLSLFGVLGWDLSEYVAGHLRGRNVEGVGGLRRVLVGGGGERVDRQAQGERGGAGGEA